MGIEETILTIIVGLNLGMALFTGDRTSIFLKILNLTIAIYIIFDLIFTLNK